MIRRSRRPVARLRIERAAFGLLDAAPLCAISTVSPGGAAYVNTAYFAWSRELELVWLSHPAARHSRNLRARPRVAIAVFDSTQVWGKPDRGIQLFGSAAELAPRDAAAAEALYAARFAAYVPAEVVGYRFYRFRAEQVKVFDEPLLGSGVIVIARVRAGGRLAWGRTDVYG